MAADTGSRPSWWARRSLRTRLTAATAAVLAAGMALAAVLLVWRLQDSLIAGLDAVIAQQAQSVAAVAQNGQLVGTLPDSGDSSPLVQVVDGSGTVIACSADLKDRSRLFSFTGHEDPVLMTVVLAHDGDDDDGVFRVAATIVKAPQGEVTVYAALPMAAVAQSTAALGATLAVGVPVLVAVLAVLSWFLVGRALRPVEVLRRQAAAIPATDLHRLLTAPAARDELSRLAETLNDLLARIEASADRQRRFVADAAHELRSPIASLRAQLEVALRHPEAEAGQDRLAGLLADTLRLGHLVDDLLALARMDSAGPVVSQSVDLDDLVLAEAHRARDRGVRILTAQVTAARVSGDARGLVRVVRNLLDNALRHAEHRVRLAVETSGDVVRLIVADDGHGIDPVDRARVFERFTRLDDARTRDEGGAGLGLAIVAEVVRMHGGSIRIDDANPGAVFIVTLPAAE